MVSVVMYFKLKLKRHDNMIKLDTERLHKDCLGEIINAKMNGKLITEIEAMELFLDGLTKNLNEALEQIQRQSKCSCDVKYG